MNIKGLSIAHVKSHLQVKLVRMIHIYIYIYILSERKRTIGCAILEIRYVIVKVRFIFVSLLACFGEDVSEQEDRWPGSRYTNYKWFFLNVQIWFIILFTEAFDNLNVELLLSSWTVIMTGRGHLMRSVDHQLCQSLLEQSMLQSIDQRVSPKFRLLYALYDYISINLYDYISINLHITRLFAFLVLVK